MYIRAACIVAVILITVNKVSIEAVEYCICLADKAVQWNAGSRQSFYGSKQVCLAVFVKFAL